MELKRRDVDLFFILCHHAHICAYYFPESMSEHSEEPAAVCSYM